MVAHHEVDPVGELQLQLDGVEKQLIAEASSGRIFGAAVDDLLKDQVSVRVIGQRREFDQTFEIAPMAVHVAADDERSGLRQMNEAAPSIRVRLVSLDPAFKQIGRCLRHFDPF